MMERYVCIHGHFYQPPREDPWLGVVERQESAAPYHDWNERVTAECYAPNASAPILGPDGRIARRVNNYSKISFNFGPTLLYWLERQRPEVYRAVLEADRLSLEQFSGHGSALAQVYNHMIMPLGNRRDKYTQACWGVKDFAWRFRRPPEGMWLPETAVDVETLEVLAELGIKFTILAPHQVARTREIGGEWRDAAANKIDPTRPYVLYLPSGRSIAIFAYDGGVARDIAFGELLSDGAGLARRLLEIFQDERGLQLAHVATDGETYGHHRRFGDLALAYCCDFIAADGSVRLTNYGAYLAAHPPAHEAEIVERTSWSCVHGIGRWRENCGCRLGARPEWNQEWRKPLREAMDWLGGATAKIYAEQAARAVKDPWRARDDYVEVMLDPSPQSQDRFLLAHGRHPLGATERARIFQLLEMAKYALLIYTSCGWFFDEISGIETVQVLRYAARAIELARELSGVDLEAGYLRLLERAPSNACGNGAAVYHRFVKQARAAALARDAAPA